MKNIRHFIVTIMCHLVAVISLFFICEVLLSRSLSHTISVFYEICCVSNKPLAERLHTGYDPLLGWVNLPNIYIENIYGNGKYLRTNGQSFRNNYDFSLSPPQNKIRILCSGDSFTLGYGVDNDHNWCQLLVSMNNRLETVNLGQGGYGIDQAYLLYKRDGTKLEHDIHIFAFITTDFRRMQSDQFGGYSKPVLKLRDKALVIDNVPVPEPSFYKIFVNYKQQAMKELVFLNWLKRLFSQSELETKTNKGDVQIKEVAHKVFQDLQQVNQQRQSTLVLVYLPTLREYKGKGFEPWRQYLLTEARINNFLYIDLFDEFRKLPSEMLTNYFLPEVSMGGHYTEEGNAFIAKLLYDKLLAIPEISYKLNLQEIRNKNNRDLVDAF